MIFLFSFDLKLGYHHIDIFPEHRKFLTFSWSFEDGSLRYFMFSVLPFGLSSAPYIFTKILRPLVKKWRGEGKSVLLFLDDGLGTAQPFNLAKICSFQSILIYLSSACYLTRKNVSGNPVRALSG